MAEWRTGCAGWNIPRETAAAFPAGGSHLERYAAVFNAVEINSSFYRPHQAPTYARWAASVPAGFRFAVKMPKHITHELRLADCGEALRQFAAEAGALGDKLGCVLVQLPPSLRYDDAVATGFVDAVRALFPCLIACEARHPSWFGAQATALLRQGGVSRVIADPPVGDPGPHVATAPAAYIRLHGSPRIYYSAYEDERLARVAEYMRAQHDAWCVFDNTAAGAAVPNALSMRQRLQP